MLNYKMPATNLCWTLDMHKQVQQQVEQMGIQMQADAEYFGHVSALMCFEPVGILLPHHACKCQKQSTIQ